MVVPVPLNAIEIAILRHAIQTTRARVTHHLDGGDPLTRIERMTELDKLGEKLLAFFKEASREGSRARQLGSCPVCGTDLRLPDEATQTPGQAD